MFRALAILVAAWFTALQVPPIVAGFRTKASAAQKQCIVLSTPARDRYSLSYGDHTCMVGDGPPLPTRLYDSVWTWTFNTNWGHVIPALDAYRIYARLASKESRVKPPAGPSPHGGAEWQPQYEWVHDAQYAYFAALEGRKPPGMASRELGRQLVEAGLAEYQHGDLKVRERARWPWVRGPLIKILAHAEDELRKDSAMTNVRNQVNRDNYYARRNLLQFDVELGFSTP